MSQRSAYTTKGARYGTRGALRCVYTITDSSYRRIACNMPGVRRVVRGQFGTTRKVLCNSCADVLRVIGWTVEVAEERP